MKGQTKEYFIAMETEDIKHVWEFTDHDQWYIKKMEIEVDYRKVKNKRIYTWIETITFKN